MLLTLKTPLFNITPNVDQDISDNKFRTYYWFNHPASAFIPTVECTFLKRFSPKCKYTKTAWQELIGLFSHPKRVKQPVATQQSQYVRYLPAAIFISSKGLLCL